MYVYSVRAGQDCSSSCHLLHPTSTRKRSRFSTCSPALCVITACSLSCCDRCCGFIMVLAHVSQWLVMWTPFICFSAFCMLFAGNASVCMCLLGVPSNKIPDWIASAINFSAILETRSLRRQGAGGFGFSWAPLLGLQDAAFSLSSCRLPLCVQISSSYEGTPVRSEQDPP